MKRLACVFVVSCSRLAGLRRGQLRNGDSGNCRPPTRRRRHRRLSFAADWSVTQSAAVVSGGTATIHYDLARLPEPPRSTGGGPAWGIVAYWAVDGGQAFTQAVEQYQGGVNVPVDVTFDVLPGSDLALWFFASDEFGCTQWDSNYGSNFHFAIEAGAPAVHFRWPVWSDDQSAPLQAGSDLLVDYDIRRLPYCRQAAPNGGQSWDVDRRLSLRRRRSGQRVADVDGRTSTSACRRRRESRRPPAQAAWSCGSRTTIRPAARPGIRPTARTTASTSRGDIPERGRSLAAQTRRPDHQPRRLHHRSGGARPPARRSGATPSRPAGQRRGRNASSWRCPIPSNLHAVDQVKEKTGMSVEVCLAETKALRRAIDRYYFPN